MRFTVEAAALSDALSLTRTVVEKRSTILVLECARLNVVDGLLTVEATNMGQSFRTSLAVTMTESGSACLSAHRLADIAGAMPKGAKIEIQQDKDKRYKVRSGRSLFTLAALPSEDLPPFPVVKDGTHGTLSVEALTRIIRLCGFATSSDPTRPYINGIHWCVRGNALLRSHATDGYRGVMVDTPLPNGFRPEGIVPREALVPLGKLLADAGQDEAVSLEMSDRLLSFEIGPRTLTTKLIDATYPELDRLFPEPGPVRLTADTAELKTALARIGVISEDADRVVKAEIGHGEIRLSTMRGASGEGEETVSPVETEGEVSIGFQNRYLRDFLDRCGETVTLHMTDAVSPMLVLTSDDPAVRFVTLPYRV